MRGKVRRRRCFCLKRWCGVRRIGPFVSFIYERELAGEDSDALIAHSIGLWHARLLAKLEAATRTHPPAAEVDLPSLADQVFTIFEGGFILARATKDATALRAQLAHLRQYLELLFGVQAPEAAGEVDSAALMA